MNSNNNENQNQIAGAITYPEESINNEEINVPQPRQPANLQGLLRFAMEATKSEDAPNESPFQQMDEESRKFLEEALKSLTVDVIEVLLKAINILRTAGDLSVDSDITEYINAFDTIVDYIDRIDNAIDFHKIGGYDIFEPCFNCVHAPIRANACNLLAELCQNNPYCQDKALEQGYIKILLEFIKTDLDTNVAIKSLYALSCILREHEQSLSDFKIQNGISTLMGALHRPVLKIRIKICFLLSALSNKHTDIKTDLLNADFIQLCISFLSEERSELHEHILSALTTIIEDFQPAIEECQKSEYGLQSILENHLKLIENLEEAKEERDYCHQILLLVFSKDCTCVER